MEEHLFLDRINEWTRQWGEREYYLIKHDDLLFALTHDLCEVIVLNRKVLCGAQKQYLFYRNVIRINDKIFINLDQRIAGH